MYEIEVIYKCWGCGSENVAIEETHWQIPSREQWNLCPECQAAVKDAVIERLRKPEMND